MGKRVIDLTGQIFGKWKVIKLDKVASAGSGISARWICKCECKQIRSVSSSALRSGTSQSCGHEKKDNLVDQKFGTLIVIKEDLERKTLNRKWVCKCLKCGKLISVLGGSLKNGRTINCGCRYERFSVNHYHEYKIWKEMIRRCSSDKCNSYNDYGGRGITVCNSWVESFENFYSDMGDKPDHMSIDRKDVNGNYCPSNCRWADDYTQANNRRDNIFVECNGISITISQWARLLSITPRILYDRLGRLNQLPEQAFFKNGNTIPVAQRTIVERVPIAK